MIERLANAPNGGNKQQVEYTLIDDMEEMQYFRQIVAEKMTGLAARGLGAVMLTFPLWVLRVMPEVKALLNIPDSHYTAMMIGFGYPEILYRRGARRKTSESRIHRLSFTTD